jgi:O-acetyl-ADP-ribose deacetylase (regulator of RNase III)
MSSSAASASSMSLRAFSSVRQTGTHEIGRIPATRHSALEFVTGDISQEVSDAIVNPAGPGLVDLAIRRAAGPELLEAFHRKAFDLPNQRLSPGRAIVTPGFGLRAGHVIHCAPPFYADDPVRARENLEACHVESMRLARERGLTSISFPAIATGLYRFPVEEAAEIAVRTVVAELRAHGGPRLVRFVLFDAPTLRLYAEAARVRLDEVPTQDERGAVFKVTSSK